MSKLAPTVIVLLLIGGGYYFFKHYNVEGLEQVKIKPKDNVPAAPAGTAPADRGAGDVIRIASYNIQVFGEAKLGKPHVVKILAETVRRFDVVAIQEVRARSDEILPRFVREVNAAGARYDFVIGPRLGRTNSTEQYAFVYNTATLECDRGAVYTVDDPDDLLHREPLVAAFRARGVPPEQAFTFSLVNIHTDPDEVEGRNGVPGEIDVLADVFAAVRSDGRNEDDVILLGDLNADDYHFGRLGRVPGITWAISGVPTNTADNKLFDNLLFLQRPTVEYTGRGGVLNLKEEYRLSLNDAQEVSDHFPVWAEFSVYEGGQPGRLATRPR